MHKYIKRLNSQLFGKLKALGIDRMWRLECWHGKLSAESVRDEGTFSIKPLSGKQEWCMRNHAQTQRCSDPRPGMWVFGIQWSRLDFRTYLKSFVFLAMINKDNCRWRNSSQSRDVIMGWKYWYPSPTESGSPLKGSMKLLALAGLQAHTSYMCCLGWGNSDW